MHVASKKVKMTATHSRRNTNYGSRALARQRERVLSLVGHLLAPGFIDFIVEPTFTVLTDMTEKIVTPLIDDASRSGLTGFRRSR